MSIRYKWLYMNYCRFLVIVWLLLCSNGIADAQKYTSTAMIEQNALSRVKNYISKKYFNDY